MTPPDRLPAALRNARNALDDVMRQSGYYECKPGSGAFARHVDAHAHTRLPDAIAALDALLARGTVEYLCPTGEQGWMCTLPRVRAGSCGFCGAQLQPVLVLPLDQEASA